MFSFTTKPDIKQYDNPKIELKTDYEYNISLHSICQLQLAQAHLDGKKSNPGEDAVK